MLNISNQVTLNLTRRPWINFIHGYHYLKPTRELSQYFLWVNYLRYDNYKKLPNKEFINTGGSDPAVKN
jgi:hypothetical protein